MQLVICERTAIYKITVSRVAGSFYCTFSSIWVGVVLVVEGLGSRFANGDFAQEVISDLLFAKLLQGRAISYSANVMFVKHVYFRQTFLVKGHGQAIGSSLTLQVKRRDVTIEMSS